MSNITRKDWIRKFFDTVFHNKSVSIGKDGELNNTDNRFAKCTFSKAYYDMMMKIINATIYKSVVKIKNRNTKRNGECTMISHDEIMKRLSYFICWMFRIDIYYYYDCISTIEDIPVKREDLIFEILSNIMLKEVFNPSKIETKSTGYGYINIESLEIHLKNFLKKRFNDKWIYEKMAHHLTTYLVGYIDFEAQVNEEPDLYNETIENSSVSELLNRLNLNIDISERKLIMRYLLINNEKLFDINNYVIVKTYWRTIECFKLHKWRTDMNYYFREFLFMLEDKIKFFHSDYFTDTFELYVQAYSNRLNYSVDNEIRSNLEKEEDFYEHEWL